MTNKNRPFPIPDEYVFESHGGSWNGYKFDRVTMQMNQRIGLPKVRGDKLLERICMYKCVDIVKL